MSQLQGLNKELIKQKNRGLVLRMICCNTGCSRIDISRQIGLTKMTVTNIVNQLMEDGFVEEREIVSTTQVGRNPITLSISSRAPKIIGLMLSRSACEVIVSDLMLTPLFREKMIFGSLTSTRLTEIIDGLLKKAEEFCGKERILGIGVASLGPMDKDSGILLSPTDFYGIERYPIKALIEERYAYPVYLENDMNAAALAEKLYGLGKPLHNFLYVGITNGIGSGIVTNDRLYQNHSGYVGEFGHTTIRYDGELCSCGNRGCLEVYANMPVICRKLRDVAERPVTAEEFEELSQLPQYRPVFDDMAEKLSAALINVVNMLDPQCIILGHDAYYLPTSTIQQLEHRVNCGILAHGYKRISVMRSAFGVDAPLFGSACCVSSELFEGNLVPASTGDRGELQK